MFINNLDFGQDSYTTFVRMNPGSNEVDKRTSSSSCMCSCRYGVCYDLWGHVTLTEEFLLTNKIFCLEAYTRKGHLGQQCEHTLRL